MAPAIVHFLVGASIVLLVATPFVARYGVRTLLPLWLVVVGGLWGLFPDIHHITPVYQTELYALHNSPWADLFAFHYTLDRPFVRVRYVESIFLSILLFLASVAVFSFGDAKRPASDSVETTAPSARS